VLSKISENNVAIVDLGYDDGNHDGGWKLRVEPQRRDFSPPTSQLHTLGFLLPKRRRDRCQSVGEA